MATLVLTAVGSAVGGPIGGAVGALLGQSLDRRLFGRGRREGPRLNELAVQTSSYGAPIPQLFGTMRVAGSVIWATDLIETRSTARGGKGQPGTASYSYQASFAVLLSARPIRRLRRVWAEGKLLRGAAGDLKAAGAMRLHLGGEDQPVDPLIASAEGALAPAHRGCAYAVFEGLALADFGNRIPSLTFEVEADEGAVPVAAIARAVAREVSGDVGLALAGFATGGGSVRAVLEMLGTAAGGWFAPVGAGVVLSDGAGPVTVLTDAGVAVEGAKGVRGARAVAPVASVPRTLTLAHYDPARDYQTGVQRATRQGTGAGTREERVELPAVIPAATAGGIAAAMLARAETERTRRTLTLGFAGLAVAPGQVVAIAGEPGRWRVEAVAVERMVARVTLVPLAAPMVPYEAASGGRVLGASDLVAGRTLLHVAELPALDETLLTRPRLSVLAAGEGAGWRGAALLVSIDEGASWQEAGATAAPAVIGVLDRPLAAAPATLIDRTGSIEVTLAHAGMTLGDADAGALDRGANLALVGDELIQFGSAAPLSPTRWRLSELWRGRRATEAVTGHDAGTRFALVEPDAVRAIDLPVSMIGRTVRVMAAGIGDGDAPVEASVVVSGRSVAPPVPVHLHAASSDGDTTIAWTRRSRLGWSWRDGVDAPLGEEREAYRVTLSTGDETWEEEVAEPRLVVTAARRAGRELTVAVRQRGTVAASAPATLVLEGEG